MTEKAMETPKRIEEWRLFRNGPYEVSNLGRVRRNQKLFLCKPKPSGYVRICLHIDRQKIFIPVHWMVLECFVGPRPEGKECDHIDRNRSNNCATNLRWVTRKENAQNRPDNSGESHPQSKLDSLKVAEICRRRMSGEERESIAKDYGITPAYVSHLAMGRYWRNRSTTYRGAQS